MTFNLVDLIKEQFNAQTLEQAGKTIGADASQTSAAIDGAIPAILQSLLTSTESDSGAESMYSTVQQHNADILDDLSSVLEGQNRGVLAAGLTALGSLLGDDEIGTLARSVAGFSGVENSSGTSLLGLLAPVIFAVLLRKAMSENLDAGGLAAMLSAQQDNIEAAMPQQLSGLIK